MTYDRNITLSDEIANEVFLKWYNTKKFYNYKVEPASTNTTDFGKFIVQTQDIDNNIFGVINKLPYKIWK